MSSEKSISKAADMYRCHDRTIDYKRIATWHEIIEEKERKAPQIVKHVALLRGKENFDNRPLRNESNTVN